MTDMAKQAKHYRKRGNSYFLNLRIPKAVRHHYPNKTHLTDKLHATTDKEARAESFRKKQEYEQEFADRLRGVDVEKQLEATSLAPLSIISRDEIDRIVKVWFFQEQDKLFQRAHNYITEDDPEDFALIKESFIDTINMERNMWQGWGSAGYIEEPINCDAIDRRKVLEETRNLLLTSHGIDPQSDQDSDIAVHLLTRIRAAYTELSFQMYPIMIDGETSPKTHDGFFKNRPQQRELRTASASSEVSTKEDITLQQAIALYVREGGRLAGLRPKTAKTYRSQLAFLTSAVGKNTPLNSLNYERMIEVLAQLQHYPSHAEKRYPELSFEERLEKAKTLSEAELLSTKTIEKYLLCYSGFFGFCIEADKYHGKNPMLLIKASVKRGKRERVPYSLPDLNKLFANPQYERSFLRDPSVEDYFWVPLLALFTGMRLSECCQLRCEDLKREGKIMYLHIQEDDSNEEGARKVKTKAGKRKVPVHSRLIELGFLDYCQRMQKKQGNDRLFPSIPFSNHQSPYRKMQRTFSEHLDKLDIKTPENNYCFHSFRHTAASESANNGLAEDSMIHNMLFGWENKGQAANYTSISLERLQAAIETLTYNGLDLSHLKRPYPPYV